MIIIHNRPHKYELLSWKLSHTLCEPSPDTPTNKIGIKIRRKGTLRRKSFVFTTRWKGASTRYRCTTIFTLGVISHALQPFPKNLHLGHFAPFSVQISSALIKSYEDTLPNSTKAHGRKWEVSIVCPLRVLCKELLYNHVGCLL